MKKCNQWMFEKVRCKGYMKKVKDGRCIIKRKKEEMQDHQEHYFYEYGEIGTEAKEIDLFEECGGPGLLKTYHKYTAKDFDGVVVGMKMVEVSAWLYVDYYDDEYHAGYYVGKRTEEQRKCALVYYGCNKSRLVPMEDLEIIKEGEE